MWQCEGYDQFITCVSVIQFFYIQGRASLSLKLTFMALQILI